MCNSAGTSEMLVLQVCPVPLGMESLGSYAHFRQQLQTANGRWDLTVGLKTQLTRAERVQCIRKAWCLWRQL